VADYLDAEPPVTGGRNLDRLEPLSGVFGRGAELVGSICSFDLWCIPILRQALPTACSADSWLVFTCYFDDWSCEPWFVGFHGSFGWIGKWSLVDVLEQLTEPAHSLRDKSNVIGGWLPTLTFALWHFNCMRRFSFIIAVCTVICTVCGCTDRRQAVVAAEQTLLLHFEAIRRGEADNALSRYSPDFFQQPKRDREHWRASLTSLRGLRDFTIVHRQCADGSNSHGEGTLVSFKCRTSYASASYKEYFEFFRRTGSTNFLIVRHDFD